MMLELYQLRYFMAVVETGSFTKAAAAMNVTQPTLSAGIAKLESTLDTKLFDRSNRRVFLTGAGARFVERAKAILYECNRATAEVKEADPEPAVRLGLLITIPAVRVAALARDFRKKRPDARLELFDGSEQELLNRLDDGSIDIALTILRPHWLDRPARPLYEEGYALALAADHPLAHESAIDGRSLANQPMIVRSRCEVLSETSRYFTARNVRPPLVYRTRSDERALEMVAAGAGITVMPENYDHPYVARVAMTGFNHRRTVGLVRGLAPRDQGQAQAVLDFMELAG